MDHLTPQQRHKNMAAIRGKNTKPEMIVRKGLWKRGFRYRLNHRRLPGHPDLVLRKYRTCIFVNGCFWHGHGVTMSPVQGVSKVQGVQDSQLTTSNKSFIIESSECCKIPRTNREFWVAKIRRNMERDHEDQRKLAELGWHCITVWECELKSSRREETLDSIAYTLNHIWLQDRRMKSRNYGITEDEEVQLMAAEEEITGQ